MKETWKLFTAILLSMLLAIGSSCKKDDPENNDNNNGGGGNNTTSDVRVTTYTPQDITATTAKCGGDAIVTQGLSLTGIGICWSTESSPLATGFHLMSSNWNEPFVCTITGLEPDTKYYIRAFALRGLEYYYGEEKTFVTEPGDVNVATYTPHDITATSAVCGGEVIESSGIISVLGVCWNTSSNPTVDGFHSSTTNWNEPYICTLTGLEPDTKYYVRAYAMSGMECYYGAEMEFTTASVGLPPTISVYQGNGYIKDGDILDLDTEYQFGFEVSSDKGLSFFSVEIDGYNWANVALQGLTSYTFTDVITYTASKDEIIGESTINAVVTDVDGLMNSASILVLINQPAHQLETFDFEWVRQGPNSLNEAEMAEYGLYWAGNYKDIFATIKPLDGAVLFVCDGDDYANITTDIEKAAYFVSLMESSSPVESYRNISINSSENYNDMLAVVDSNGRLHLIHVTRAEVEFANMATCVTIKGEAK